MKLLLDQGLPRSSAELLRQEGLDAVHTGECGLSEASDDAILAAGRAQGRTVVTLDSDFHTILALEEAMPEESSAYIIFDGMGGIPEMGAFSNLKQPWREAQLGILLKEYLPFGLKAGVFYVT